jgi:hypothetical protein
MSEQVNGVEVGRDTLATLALETWRAAREVERGRDLPGSVGLRYSLRKIRAALEEIGISYIDAAGGEYHAGMAVDVVDIDGDEGGDTQLVIKETVAPIILLRGALLSWGEVVLERRPITQQPI